MDDFPQKLSQFLIGFSFEIIHEDDFKENFCHLQYQYKKGSQIGNPFCHKGQNERLALHYHTGRAVLVGVFNHKFVIIELTLLERG